jgi:hypothetical protein
MNYQPFFPGIFHWYRKANSGDGIGNALKKPADLKGHGLMATSQ